MNELFLQALQCKPTQRPPVWLMRQSGRFIPEYRQLRSKYSFRTLITTPELSVQATKIPLDLFNPDAAILFSDILLLPEVFGFKIDFSDGKGIRLLEPTEIGLDDQKREVAETLSCVASAIKLLKSEIKVPLIGFCGGPYTVAKYMKRVTPEWLEKITEATIAYLQLQIDAGVDAIQIFDSWAGALSHPDFITLSLPYLQKVVGALQDTKIPIILFCRSSHFIEELSALKPSGIGFDWEKEMVQLRKEVPCTIAVQGNLDPSILKGPLKELQIKLPLLIDSMKGSLGYIVNLGHGVDPATPVENVEWMINYVKSQG